MFASAALALGLTLPFVTFERLWLFSDSPSLLRIVRDLAGGGELALALLVVLVSIVFPVAKLLLAHVVALGGATPPRWLAFLSRWSMTDVLLVALVILAAKTSGLAEAASQPGVWFYAGSAIAAYAATALPRADRAAASVPMSERPPGH